MTIRFPSGGRRGLVAAALATTLLLSACGGSDDGADTGSGGDAGPVKVRLAIGSAMSPTAVTYGALPKERGYWSDGIEVEILNFPGTAAAVQAVVAGKADVAAGGPGPWFNALQAGEDLVAWCSYVTGWITPTMVPVDSPIQSFADLRGKRIGVPSLESGTVPVLRAVIKQQGMDPDRDVQIVAIGLGAEAAAAIQGNKVDVLSLFDSPYAILQHQFGIKLRSIDPPQLAEQTFGANLYSMKEFIEKNPQAIVQLGQGIAKASVFAEANPDRAVQIGYQLYPDTKPAGQSDEQALAQGKALLAARAEQSKPIDGKYCNFTQADIDRTVELYEFAGLLKTSIADLDQYWTNQYIDQINDFSADEIRTEAKS